MGGQQHQGQHTEDAGQGGQAGRHHESVCCLLSRPSWVITWFYQLSLADQNQSQQTIILIFVLSRLSVFHSPASSGSVSHFGLTENTPERPEVTPPPTGSSETVQWYSGTAQYTGRGRRERERGRGKRRSANIFC